MRHGKGQVIQIKKGGLKKPIIIANLYRPPKDVTDKYKQFIHEIIPILRYMENMNAETITGDTNLDLLKINERQVFGDFFDTLTENSFYPKITLPTRFSNKHGTLIDHMFCKLTDLTINTTSGILIKMFSDHQPYFTFLNDIHHKVCPPKFIKVDIHSHESIKNFQDELINLDIISKLDKSPTA